MKGVTDRVKVAFFSITTSLPSGDDRPYLAWHQLDHMPEQYRLPGLVMGQRWRSTPECRRARAAQADGWSAVEHVVCYLMGDPVDPTVDDFLALGRELAEAGRYSQVMPTQYRGALELLGTCAAARALVTPEVVPFRPHRGVYVLVEEPDGVDAESEWEEHRRRLEGRDSLLLGGRRRSGRSMDLRHFSRPAPKHVLRRGAGHHRVLSRRRPADRCRPAGTDLGPALGSGANADTPGRAVRVHHQMGLGGPERSGELSTGLEPGGPTGPSAVDRNLRLRPIPGHSTITWLAFRP